MYVCNVLLYSVGLTQAHPNYFIKKSTGRKTSLMYSSASSQ